MRTIKRPLLYVFSLCFIGISILTLSPTDADAKCPKGQYGLFKCLKCPANTYAYKDHIITKLGCKRCPSGYTSRAGSRRCTEKPCGSIKSGTVTCDKGKNLKKKCVKGVMKVLGSCFRSCQGTDHHGYKRGYRHNTVRCHGRKKIRCYDGKWQALGACTTPCRAWGGLKTSQHGTSLCRTSDKYTYRCESGRWVKKQPCHKHCPANRHLTSAQHGSSVCSKMLNIYRCNNGTWQATKVSCAKNCQGHKHGSQWCLGRILMRCHDGKVKSVGRTRKCERSKTPR